MSVSDGSSTDHANLIFNLTTLAAVLIALARDELGARRARRNRRERQRSRELDQDDASRPCDE